jgi:hypothetical protein
VKASGHSLGRARQRAIASIVVLLSWGTLALSFVHQATSEHRFCAEHGAFEEVAIGSEAADAAVQPVSAIATGASEGESHEACPFDCAIPTDRARFAVDLDSAVLPEGPPIDRALHLEPVSPVDLLSLAPKNSPPRG